MNTDKNPVDIVLAFVNALNEEDFVTAKSFLNTDFVFKGPLATREGADVYIQDMEKMRLKYQVDKTFVNDQEVCLIYKVTIGGISLPTCGLYLLKDQKLSSLTVFFDPRPALNSK
ncbi:MAG TPA: nuclear transport factor 2 family protein [Cytophagales bacterium]|nr:nuclear transport factor 2 family protein [Cytophagales bacterium]